MHRYFKTKKQAAEETKKIDTEKKRKRKEVEKEERWWKAFKEQEKERDREEINSIYEMVRYYITLDGTMRNYAENYINPYLRFDRLMFLDKSTRHDDHTRKHIESTLNRE